MENNFIQRFKVEGLFGYKNFDIKFDNPILILIGENGFGKTTILNIFYYIINFDYDSLSKIDFNIIEVEFHDKVYQFSKKLICEYNKYIKEKSSESSSSLDSLLFRFLTTEQLSELTNIAFLGKQKDFKKKWEDYDINLRVPEGMVYQHLVMKANTEQSYTDLKELENRIRGFDYQILYYPTYRRVEREMSAIFENMKNSMRYWSSEDNYSITHQFEDLSGIKFGMHDVVKRINRVTQAITTSAIQGFSLISGEMLKLLISSNNFRSETDVSEVDSDKIKIILARIGNDMLSDRDKEFIIDQVKNGYKESGDRKIYLDYFLAQLQAVYKKQEKYDNAIKNFKDVCNRYLVDKKFVYDENNVTLTIYRTVDGEIKEDLENKVELNQLSSGEKQVISIFSQVYLEIDKQFIILFDEPEISLSVYWQETLLKDIVDSGNCAFLLAVTHSPFIFDEYMQDYTIGLKEFMMSHGK